MQGSATGGQRWRAFHPRSFCTFRFQNMWPYYQMISKHVTILPNDFKTCDHITRWFQNMWPYYQMIICRWHDFFFNIDLLIYFWLHWVVVAACGLSLVMAKRGYSSAVVASLVAEHGLKSVGSVVVAHRLSCSKAPRDLPGPGIEPVSLALWHEFLTTGPPGKPGMILYIEHPNESIENYQNL